MTNQVVYNGRISPNCSQNLSIAVGDNFLILSIEIPIIFKINRQQIPLLIIKCAKTTYFLFYFLDAKILAPDHGH
jgi:hypothetical protein